MCLACEIRDAIADYYVEHGRLIDGEPVLDANEAVNHMARIIAELMAYDPDEKRRTDAIMAMALAITEAVSTIRASGQYKHMRLVMDDGQDAGIVH